MELIINNKKYYLTMEAIENSKYLDLHTRQIMGQNLILEHDNYKIKDKDIENLVSVINGGKFVVSDRIYILHILLQMLICDNKLKSLNLFIEDNIDDLRHLSVKIYLVRPDLVWNLDLAETKYLLKFVDRSCISFADLIKHTFSKDFNKGVLEQKDTELLLFNFEKYLKYEIGNFKYPRYNALSNYAFGEKILPNEDTFKIRLEKFTLGILKDFDWENVALMGGSLSLILNSKLDMGNYPYSDIDLFVVGESSEDREKTINKIIKYFSESKYRAYFYQCGAVVTVVLQDFNRNVQIIDSGHRHFAHVARGFDCGISQMWYQGDGVVCTPVVVLSLLHQINPLMNPSGSPTRFYKQYLRGYTTLLLPNIGYTKELLDFFQMRPEILENTEKFVKALNKYIQISAKDKKERVDFLVSTVYSPNFENITEYKACSMSSFWLNNYENEETRYSDLRISPKLFLIKTSCADRRVLIKNLPLENHLPDLTDDQIYGLDLVEKSGSAVYINIGKNKYLGSKSNGHSHKNQILIKLTKASKTKLYAFTRKYVKMVEKYLEKYYKGKKPHQSLSEILENKHSLYPENLYVNTCKDITFYPSIKENKTDIILKVNIKLRSREFHIVYKLAESFYYNH